MVIYTKCPNNFDVESICGSEIDMGMDPKHDGYYYDEDIQFGIGSFDSFIQAFLAVFQIITLDNWQTIMYNLQKTVTAPFLPAVFCLILIFMGAFFLLNLMLAVVMDSYLTNEIEEQRKLGDKFDEEQ
jgi:hypothetical protein